VFLLHFVSALRKNSVICILALAPMMRFYLGRNFLSPSSLKVKASTSHSLGRYFESGAGLHIFEGGERRCRASYSYNFEVS